MRNHKVKCDLLQETTQSPSFHPATVDSDEVTPWVQTGAVVPGVCPRHGSVDVSSEGLESQEQTICI